MKSLEEIFGKKVLKTLLEYVEENVSNKGVAQHPTGFLELDYCLRGLRDGEITVIASRPAMGKSALMMNMVMNTLLESEVQRPILIATGLTSATQYMLSIVACYGGIQRDIFRRGMLNDGHWQCFSECVQKIVNMPLYIDDSLRTVNELSNRVNQIVEEKGIAPIVAIDDIAWLHLKNSHFFARQSGEIVRRLKDVANQQNIPLLFTTNVSHDAEERPCKRPLLRDIEYIESYEPLVDKILLLYRHEVYQPDTQNKGIAEIQIVKNRMGSNDTVLLSFQPEYAKFLNYSGGYSNNTNTINKG